MARQFGASIVSRYFTLKKETRKEADSFGQGDSETRIDLSPVCGAFVTRGHCAHGSVGIGSGPSRFGGQIVDEKLHCQPIKQRAVEQAKQGDCSIRQLESELGISANLVRHWVRVYDKNSERA